MDAMLKQLQAERDGKLKFIDDITTQAVEGKRDLSDNEQELIVRAKTRIGEVDKQLETLSGDLELSQEAQSRLAKLQGAIQGGQSTGEVEYQTIGAYMRDFIHARMAPGNAQRHEAEDRLRKYHRAAAHITTDQFAGIFPQALVGPVINNINTTRPLVAALGPIGIPAGPTFRRPRLNDPNVDTGVGIQANQKDELVSQQFTVTSDEVPLSTLGGYVNVARQIVDWQVATVDAIVNQLAGRYARAVEKAAVAEIGRSTGHIALAADADGQAIISAIYAGAAAVFSATNELPTLIVAGPNGWARLGAAADAAGRQIFPFLAPGNAAGQQSADSFQGNPVGLRLVVTPGMTDDTYWVLNGQCAEVYEQTLPPLQVTEPSVLGIQVAFAGYFATYRPFPNGAQHLSP